MNPEEEEQNFTSDNFVQIMQRAAMGQTLNLSPDAKEARRYLQSMQQYQPQQMPNGNTVLNNPETGVKGTLGGDTGLQGGRSVDFTTDGNFSRPDNPNSKVKRIAIQASVNQLVDQIPAARDGGGSNSQYYFHAIEDEKDFRKTINRGQTGNNRTNQRSSLYRRMTNGAFAGFPDKFGDHVGYGERITQDTWQPRDAKRRYAKYVKFDTHQPVRRLGAISMERVASGVALARAAQTGNAYLFAAELIKQDVLQSSALAHGSLEAAYNQGLITAAELPKHGPPAPTQPTKAKSKKVIKAPPKKNYAVLAKQKGKTGSVINGAFFAHPWSLQQSARYSAMGGK